MKTVTMAAAVLLSVGCIIVPGRNRSAVVAAPAPVVVASSGMSYNDAVNAGTNECRSRGYQCELKEAHRTGNELWKVKFAVFRPGAKGHLHLDYDAVSGRLLRADEKVHGHGGHDDDDDDDKAPHGRGYGRKE